MMPYTEDSSLRKSTRRMPDIADYMTTEQAASALKLHIETIREFLRDKTLAGLKVGRTWLVSRASVNDYQKKTKGMEKHDPRRKEN